MEDEPPVKTLSIPYSAPFIEPIKANFLSTLNPKYHNNIPIADPEDNNKGDKVKETPKKVSCRPLKRIYSAFIGYYNNKVEDPPAPIIDHHGSSDETTAEGY